jgi:hypothetical protein
VRLPDRGAAPAVVEVLVSTHDVPVEVTMADGSRWIVYYRLNVGKGYASAIPYLRSDIKEGRLMPADDLDGIQRRSSLVNLAQVVSVRNPEAADG